MITSREYGINEKVYSILCLPGVQFDKVTFDELAEAFLQDYRINQKKSTDRAERSVRHLSGYFEGYKVPNITTPAINSYVMDPLEAGAKNATVNRELSALKRVKRKMTRPRPFTWTVN